MALSLGACSSSSADTSSDSSADVPAADSDLAYVQGKGNIVVGVTDFEPMDYIVNGEWTGFDAELALKVGEVLGVDVVFQEISWDMKETELSGKTIDVIWNGLTWTEDRAANMAMTDYYMLNKQVAVIRKDDADKFVSIDDLAGATVAAEAGSAGEEFIQANLTDSTYIESESQKYALMELLSGNVDVTILDYTMGYYLVNAEGSDFGSLMVAENLISADEEYYAIACRQGSDLATAINDCLKQLKADGTVKEIASKYGLEGSIVD